MLSFIKFLSIYIYPVKLQVYLENLTMNVICVTSGIDEEQGRDSGLAFIYQF